MRLIDQYKLIHSTVLQRAIHINNMLSELDVKEGLSQYRPISISLYDINYLKLDIEGDTVTLSHHDHYDDYTEYWTVSVDYLDMDDEDIKQDFMKLMTDRYSAAKGESIRRLKQEATYLGYELVKK